MKTAEEWAKEFDKDYRVPACVIEEATHNNISESFIKSIQLDAWKAGMLNAALTLEQSALPEDSNATLCLIKDVVEDIRYDASNKKLP